LARREPSGGRRGALLAASGSTGGARLTANALVVTAFVVSVAGIVAALSIGPSRDEVTDALDEWNGRHPERQLEFRR
jgi:hypothetical protein